MIIPLIHRILVKQDKLEHVNKDIQRAKALGLEIPELEEAKRAQASVDTGVVVAIGSTAYRDYRIECPVAVGDLVSYARFAGKSVEDPKTGELFIALNDEDLICIIKD